MKKSDLQFPGDRITYKVKHWGPCCKTCGHIELGTFYEFQLLGKTHWLCPKCMDDGGVLHIPENDTEVSRCV